MIDEVTPLALLVLAAVVAFGAVVPVVPTGAAVSAAAVLAVDAHLWEVLPVIVAGGAGAYVGDLVVYGALLVAGTGLAERFGWLEEGTAHDRLAVLRTRIEAHELRTLLVSRLVPGGRVPVLLVAALTGYPWYRFASAAVGAAGLWALVYAGVGVLGSLLPHREVALVAVVVAALVLSSAPGLVRRLVERRREHVLRTRDGRADPREG
ncbi:DedA family protein [Nocardioides bruguierae]|uniref:DedA family protein n=1 Tax=Nocardioides bruguierae TaxID=2945102 RepID=A0A9X2DBA3_9ACTN|nr:hypothetical protein [Nocardioides bruguierae]MCL8023889.1 hypothetical protein [Nocardioides bruguierae]MCM0622781.1 hypothetical protein [Nocardioides bruguierae]